MTRMTKGDARVEEIDMLWEITKQVGGGATGGGATGTGGGGGVGGFKQRHWERVVLNLHSVVGGNSSVSCRGSLLHNVQVVKV